MSREMSHEGCWNRPFETHSRDIGRMEWRQHGNGMAQRRALLVPQDPARTRFAGFLSVAGAEYKLSVSGIRYASVSGPHAAPRMVFDAAVVDAEPPLAALLVPHEALLRVRLQQASSIDALVGEIEELVAASTVPATQSPNEFDAQLPDAQYYSRLLEELDAVGWNHLVGLSEDMREVELQAHDAGGRLHSVRVSLPSDYPLSAPLCAVDAPEAFTLSWPSPEGARPSRVNSPLHASLKTILEQFEVFLNEYQAFWNALDEIDSTCCVLEPHHPSRATRRRRIALQRHVSVQVEIDPKNSRGICDLKFFGSEVTVAPLRERWSDRLFEWEEHRSVPQNIEILLDVELPSPRTAKTEEFAVECGICYCYRLDIVLGDDQDTQSGNKGDNDQDTVIPDRLCENPKCNRPFHEKCLFEWLKALPTARQSFSTVFGECPYCRDAISAKFIA